LVEAEIGLKQNGTNDADWSFVLQYGATSKKTTLLRAKGGFADAHDIAGVIKYSEDYAAGGSVNIDVNATTANGTWHIRGFRVYGIK
jgi:hypothetical protein